MSEGRNNDRTPSQKSLTSIERKGELIMHTPGPWKIAPKGYLSICPITDCGCLGTAIISTLGDGVVVAGTNCNEDREANARLIAAAPMMLDALEAMLNKEGDYLGFACFAVAEAKGESSN